MSLFQQIISIIVLILISVFFSISEISLTAAKKIKIRKIAEDGNENAKAVLALQEKPGYFFSVVQIGINIVAILGGIVGESAFKPYFKSLISMFYQGEYLDYLSFLFAFTAITSSFILFADLIPKQIAIVYPEKIALKVIKPMRFCIILFIPLVLFFTGLSKLFFKLFKIPSVPREDITSDDIVAMVAAGTSSGFFQKQEQYLIENVFELENRSVTTSMTLRDNIIWIDCRANEKEIKEMIANCVHGRFLICDNTIDNVMGYIDVKDVIKKIIPNEPLILKKESLLKQALFIPDTITLLEALKMFKSFNDDFAVILNEYSLVVGVITLGDVMSTVMGNLVPQEDVSQITVRDENSWLIEGNTVIEDIEKALNIDSFPNSGLYETIAGFMMYNLRKIPRVTDFVIHNGFKFEVVDVDQNKIDQLLVTRLPQDFETNLIIHDQQG